MTKSLVVDMENECVGEGGKKKGWKVSGEETILYGMVSVLWV